MIRRLPTEMIIPNDPISWNLLGQKIGVDTDASAPYKNITLRDANKGNGQTEILGSVRFLASGDVLPDEVMFTAYDMAVYQAVISLWVADQDARRFFTVNQVCRAMQGCTGGEHISDGMAKRVKNCMDKMCRIIADINLRDWCLMLKGPGNHRKATDKYGDAFHEPVLNLRWHEITAGGYAVGAYEFLSAPVLYQVCDTLGQVIRIPFAIFNTKDVLRQSPTVTVLKNYLIRRIAPMKHATNKSRLTRKILVDSMFQTTGIDGTNRQTRARCLAKVKKLLTHLQEKQYIHGFEIRKSGKTITAFTIHV